MKKDKTTKKTTNKIKDTIKDKKQTQKQYSVDVTTPILDPTGDTMKITFKRAGLLGKLGLSFTRDYLLADVLHETLNFIPANNMIDGLAKEDKLFTDLYNLYTESRLVIEDTEYVSGEDIIISEATYEYLKPTIGGNPKLSLISKIELLETGFRGIS